MASSQSFALRLDTNLRLLALTFPAEESARFNHPQPYWLAFIRNARRQEREASSAQIQGTRIESRAMLENAEEDRGTQENKT